MSASPSTLLSPVLQTDSGVVCGLGVERVRAIPPGVGLRGVWSYGLAVAGNEQGAAVAGAAWMLCLTVDDGALALSSGGSAGSAGVPLHDVVAWLTDPMVLLGDVLPGGQAIDGSLYLVSLFDGVVGSLKDAGTGAAGVLAWQRIRDTRTGIML